VIQRPILTYVPEVADWVREVYANSDVILEYGSGGSTALAAEMPGKTIFSVESDKVWTDNMVAYFDQEKPAAKVIMHHVNIGKTGKWGTPVDGSAFRRYHLYPLSIWDHPDFVHPDVIMVDGRFRVACALTAMLRCTKPTTLLFDDYRMRKGYHAVEEIMKPQEMRGDMARFQITPGKLPRDKLTAIIGAFARHF